MRNVLMLIVVAAGSLAAIGFLVVMPIINMVFSHQRKLAGVEGESSDRIDALEAEVQSLRDRLNEHALALDDRSRLLPPIPSEQKVRQ